MLERNTSPARVKAWLIHPSTKPEPMVLGLLISGFNFGEIVKT